MSSQALSREPVAVPCMDDNPDQLVIDAKGIHYRELNALLRQAVAEGATQITLRNVYGQRYIGTNLQAKVSLTIDGVPGQDLGAFMDGPCITVLSNAQDGCGNTMNRGEIVIHGSAGDILGHSMRGGTIYVRDNVGYRTGIHMKEYGDVRPVLVIGGTAQHFVGEYMAGGLLIVLGTYLEDDEEHPSQHVGTGMHGGIILMRGKVNTARLGREVGVVPLDAEDRWALQRYIAGYARHFGIDPAPLINSPYTKLVPLTKRPYGRLYAY